MNKNEYNTQSYSNFDYRNYIKTAHMASKRNQPSSSKNNHSKYDTNQLHQIPDRRSDFHQHHQLKQRYQQLENDYYAMMQKVQQRKLDHEVIKAEMINYEKYEQRDRAEIQRLSYLLDLYKRNRQHKAVQEADIDFGSKLSRINKFDQSTEDQIKLKNSGEVFREKKKQESIKKIESPYKKQEKSLSKHKLPVETQVISRDKYKYENKGKNLSSFQKQRFQETKINKKINNPSYSRLRFVPQNQFK